VEFSVVVGIEWGHRTSPIVGGGGVELGGVGAKVSR